LKPVLNLTYFKLVVRDVIFVNKTLPMKRSGYILVFAALAIGAIMAGCIKTEEVDDNMKQTFSIPLGEKSLKIDAPVIIDNSSSFFYNGRPYLIVGKNFKKSETIDFEMDSISKDDIIKGIDFKVRFENSYPANAFIQIYHLNNLKQVTDSFFTEGLRKIPAGEVNVMSEPDIISTTVMDAEFHGERLEHLRNAEYLNYVFYLETQREDGAPLKFTNNSDIKINLAMRLYLQYNLNEL
jgi:hypothetical protein